jgi:hypothetical protein
VLYFITAFLTAHCPGESAVSNLIFTNLLFILQLVEDIIHKELQAEQGGEC